VGEIVRVHNCADVRLFDGSFERGQVYFAHRSLVDNRVNIVAIELRVIPHEMLNGGAYALILHPLDIADRDPRGEKRVFAEILEVAAIHWRAINVHARTHPEVHAAGTSSADKLRADPLGT